MKKGTIKRCPIPKAMSQLVRGIEKKSKIAMLEAIHSATPSKNTHAVILFSVSNCERTETEKIKTKQETAKVVKIISILFTTQQ